MSHRLVRCFRCGAQQLQLADHYQRTQSVDPMLGSVRSYICPENSAKLLIGERRWNTRAQQRMNVVARRFGGACRRRDPMTLSLEWICRQCHATSSTTVVRHGLPIDFCAELVESSERAEHLLEL